MAHLLFHQDATNITVARCMAHISSCVQSCLEGEAVSGCLDM